MSSSFIYRKDPLYLHRKSDPCAEGLRLGTKFEVVRHLFRPWESNGNFEKNLTNISSISLTKRLNPLNWKLVIVFGWYYWLFFFLWSGRLIIKTYNMMRFLSRKCNPDLVDFFVSMMIYSFFYCLLFNFLVANKRSKLLNLVPPR